jgi:hypothetical protein
VQHFLRHLDLRSIKKLRPKTKQNGGRFNMSYFPPCGITSTLPNLYWTVMSFKLLVCTTSTKSLKDVDAVKAPVFSNT